MRSTPVHSEKDVIERSPNVRAVRRLTDFSNTRWVSGLALFPDGRKLLLEMLDQEIVESSEQKLYSNLWAVDVAIGGGMQRWTDGKYFDGGPCFSADGQFVYFSSNRAGKNSIFRLSINNLKGLGLVTTGATTAVCRRYLPTAIPLCGPPQWRGQRFLNCGVCLFLTASSGLSQYSSRRLWFALVAKRKDRALFVSGSEYRKNEDMDYVPGWSSNPTQLTTRSSCNDIDPVWFPDGSRIVFASDR